MKAVVRAGAYWSPICPKAGCATPGVSAAAAENSVSMFGHLTFGYRVGGQEADVPSWLTVRW
jgi:hypothetical protein